MNITRENLSDLDIRLKVDIDENDYKEEVNIQLKKYRQRATVPGFRKGNAPMGMIQRMYKSAVVSEVVEKMMSEALFKYLHDEDINIVGSPLANDELTPAPDFEHDTTFTFYFDSALMPNINIDWGKVNVTMPKIAIADEDIDKQIEYTCQQYGKFETPETVGESDYIYGKAVELDADGNAKEGGVSSFVSFSLTTLEDHEVATAFVGKKAEDKVVFNAAKAFNAADIEKHFHLKDDDAKNFNADIELTISGCSRITPHPIDEELFNKVFPGEQIAEAEAFRNAVAANIDKANDEQCSILYVNEVRKALIDNFDAPIPEAFLKRWICQNDKENKLTPEQVEADWEEKYLPSLKWEFVDVALNKIEKIEPSYNEIIDTIKDILGKNTPAEEGESEEARNKRIDEAAKSIANDENNTRQIVDKLYVNKTCALFRKQLNPTVETINAEQFKARCQK